MSNSQAFRSDISEIICKTSIKTPQIFSYDGIDISVNTESPDNSLPPVVTALQNHLYQHCFTQPHTKAYTQNVENNEDLTEMLSQANFSKSLWSQAWTVQKIEPQGYIQVIKQGRERYVCPGEFLVENGGNRLPQPGDLVNIYQQRESKQLQPGFYFAFGETDSWDFEPLSLIRFYWNLKLSGAKQLMELITYRFNRFQVPFHFKCVTQSCYFNRIDSAVLYVNKHHYDISSALISGILTPMQEYLNPETSLFTKGLAPGIGFAEDPGSGESFGMNRCLILARSLYNAWASGTMSDEQKTQLVFEQLKLMGINIDHPYLCNSVADCYPKNRIKQFM